LAQHNTTKNADLDNLKNTQHFSASHTEFLQRYKGLHLLQKISENPISHTLFDPSNLKANFNSSKAKSVKNSNLFFFD